VSEQVSTAPDGGEQRPSDGKTRKGLVIGILGGFLTAGALVLALNGSQMEANFCTARSSVPYSSPCHARLASVVCEHISQQCVGGSSKAAGRFGMPLSMA
jgi:hypothetical protein